MTPPNLRFEPAAHFSSNELMRLWNRAYEDYFVPIAFTEAQLQRHMRRAEVDLDLSLVALRHGEADGLSFAARRADHAYIAGFGVAKPARRNGVASALIAHQLMHLAQRGVQAVQLEVVEANPARQVYAQAGFHGTRRLLVLDGQPVVPPHPGVPLNEQQAALAHQRLHREAPTWRRRWPSLAQALRDEGAVALGVTRGDAIEALAVTVDSGLHLGVLDAVAWDIPSAHALWAALAVASGGRPLRLVDEPEGSAVALAARDAGLLLGLTQMEMRASLR